MTVLFDHTMPTADGQTVQVAASVNGPHESVWVRAAGIGTGYSVRMSRSEALELACDLLDAYKAIKSHVNNQQKAGIGT